MQVVTELHKKRIKAFIDALESGKYKKAVGVLRYSKESDTCYCVEGLLCELYRKRVRNGFWTHDDFILNGSRWGGVAPPEVTQYFFGGEPLGLWSKNDKGWSFSRIAKFIRKKFQIKD